MKVYVFKLKNMLAMAVIAIAIVFCCTMYYKDMFEMVAVSSEAKQVPIYYVDTEQKKVAITFDCAWGADDIDEILKILEEEDAKATFFPVGEWAEKYSDKVKKIVEAGHDIGNHSQSHKRLGKVTDSVIKEEIENCNNTIKKITGKDTNLFRPPYGDYSNSVINIANQLNMYSIQWDVDSLDWKPEMTKSDILKRINDKVKAGSIILFHNDTKYTKDVLREVIQNIKNKGYECVAVSQLIYTDNYYIASDGAQKQK